MTTTSSNFVHVNPPKPPKMSTIKPNPNNLGKIIPFSKLDDNEDKFLSKDIGFSK